MRGARRTGLRIHWHCAHGDRVKEGADALGDRVLQRCQGSELRRQLPKLFAARRGCAGSNGRNRTQCKRQGRQRDSQPQAGGQISKVMLGRKLRLRAMDEQTCLRGSPIPSYRKRLQAESFVFNSKPISVRKKTENVYSSYLFQKKQQVRIKLLMFSSYRESHL